MAQVKWSFSKEEINRTRGIIADQRDNPFVRTRREKNVKKAQITVTEQQFWNAHLAALLTSQQRSGPDSYVSQFLKNEIHTLGLDRCRDANNISRFVSEILEEHGGIRYYNNIGDACERNLKRLDSSGWAELWDELEKLIVLREREHKDADYATERQVSTFLSDRFAGGGLHRVGSKQSRNMLQILGLTRFEIPLDSRITKWLNANFDLPYRVSGDGLGNPEYYHFIMDLVQDGCAKANVVPCIFDAAVFSSYDTNWTQSDAKAIF